MSADSRPRRWRWWMSPLAALLIAAAPLTALQAKELSPQTGETEILEIEIGEPIGDAVARSTRKYDFRIPLDMQSLDIPGDGDKPDGLRIVLRNGAGKSIAFPWQAHSGVIWMYVGVTDEIDLKFRGFEDRRLSGEGAVSDDPNEADIAAIAEIYEQVLSLSERPRNQSHCYRNELRLAESSCSRVIMATDRHSLEALAATLRAYRAEVAAEDWETSKNDPALVLNLGQWWFPNGNLAMLQVMPEFDSAAGKAGGKMPFRLGLRVNVKDHFNSAMIRLALSCHDQQAIFPEK